MIALAKSPLFFLIAFSASSLEERDCSTTVVMSSSEISGSELSDCSIGVPVI